MPPVLGLDIGATSVGFVVIDHEFDLATGRIYRLGERIIPEARDPQGMPLNRKRREAYLRRYRLCRR